jgi:hypothetical protein
MDTKMDIFSIFQKRNISFIFHLVVVVTREIIISTYKSGGSLGLFFFIVNVDNSLTPIGIVRTKNIFNL